MPNHTCCVPGCNNRHTKTKKGTKYYKFLQDAKLRRIWLTKISREHNFIVTSNTRGCSEHFEEGTKDENNQVPTIFQWKEPPTKKPPRQLPQERVASLHIPSPPAKKQRPAPPMKKQQPTSVTSEDEPRHLYHVSTGIQSTPELAAAAAQCESDRVFVHALLDQIDRWRPSVHI